MLTRRRKSDTFLATVSRHRWSRQITMKIDDLLELKRKTPKEQVHRGRKRTRKRARKKKVGSQLSEYR